MMQNGDVFLFQSLDDGDIRIENGMVEMTAGLETAVYLSLFSPQDFYGNSLVDTPEQRLFSFTEKIISNKPKNSKNYRLLQDAIVADLDWILQNKLANSISVEVVSDGRNNVRIEINLELSEKTQSIILPVEWGVVD